MNCASSCGNCAKILSKLLRINWQVLDTQQDYLLYRLFYGINSYGTSVHHISRLVIHVLWRRGFCILEEVEGAAVMCPGLQRAPSFPFLCWGAVAGVTQDFSVKYLCIVSLAPCKGVSGFLPFWERLSIEKGRRFFFFFLSFLKWTWQLRKSPLGKQPISWKIALSASSFFYKSLDN